MVASSVLDFASDTSRESVAIELIRSALADIASIDRVDQILVGQALPETFDRPTAEMLRTTYQTWCGQVESLECRIGILERSSLVGATELARAYGRTRAMLSTSLDDIEESLHDIAEGRVIPAEEVRRELRLRSDQARQA